MVILFPKNHNPHFPLLILFIRDTLLPVFIFLSYKVCLLQIHVPDVCGLAFLALPIWAVCLVSLTGSSSGSPWPPHPRPHHKRQQCVGKYQMTSPATHQLEGGQGPAGCHPRRAGEGKKKKNAREFTCSASSLFSFHLCLQSGSLYSFKPGSKKNTQLSSAGHSDFPSLPPLPLKYSSLSIHIQEWSN